MHSERAPKGMEFGVDIGPLSSYPNVEFSIMYWRGGTKIGGSGNRVCNACFLFKGALRTVSR